LELYVINLDRSTDRLEHIRTVFGAFDLAFTRVAAIDGANLSEEEFALLARKCQWYKALTRAEVGCLLSHRRCLHLAMRSEAPYTAIFEDDITLSPKIIPLLRNWHWIPEGTDMIKLDTAGIVCMTGPLHKLDGDVGNYRLGRLLNKHFCTGGYIVARQAAARLYQITESAFAPIDEIYYNPDCGILPLFNIQQMVPAPVIQAGFASTVRAHPFCSRTNIGTSCDRQSPLLSWGKRLKREWQRMKKKYLRPLWLVLTRRCRWGKIDFG